MSSQNWVGQGLQQITLSQVQPLSPSSIFTTDLFDSQGLSQRHPEVKKYEVYESPEDLLVLSSTWKRLRDERTSTSISRLLDKELFKHITHGDRTKAEEIRDYYSKKIMMWRINDIKLTKYREDLNKFIHSDGKMFQENMIGLAYHLPEFYGYDQNIDYIRVTCNQTLDKNIRGSVSMSLIPLKRFERNTRVKKQKQYWFKEKNSNSAVVIKILKDNPLEHIWNKVFDNSTNLIIKTHNSLSYNMDKLQVLQPKDWELISNN